MFGNGSERTRKWRKSTEMSNRKPEKGQKTIWQGRVPRGKVVSILKKRNKTGLSLG